MIMNNKIKRIPFDLERAKRITNGEEEGRIVTRIGRDARIVCFDVRGMVWPLLVLVKHVEREIEIAGFYDIYGVDPTGNRDDNLFLEVPDDTPACEFKPFDKVLVRNSSEQCWRANIFSHFSAEDEEYDCISGAWDYCIPYNDDTAHLLGTNEDWEG